MGFAEELPGQLVQISNDKKIDVIICHSHTSVAIAALKFRKLSGVPVAAVTHGNIFTRPKGTYDAFLTYLFRWATKRSYQQSDLIIALSPFMQTAAIENGAKKESVQLIPNGLNFEQYGKFDVEQLFANRSGTRQLKLLSVGRLCVEKDVITTLEGFALAIEINPNMSLTIVGDGPLRADCEQEIVNLNLQRSVTLNRSVGLCRDRTIIPSARYFLYYITE